MQEPIETAGRVIKAVEKIQFVDIQGRPDTVCEITFRLPLERRDYLRLAKCKIAEDYVKVTIVADQFQTSLPMDDWLAETQQ